MKLATRFLVLILLLSALPIFAGDDDNEPAPHFRARTMAGESFNNESTKGKVVLFEFWTTLVPVLPSGSGPGRADQ